MENIPNLKLIRQVGISLLFTLFSFIQSGNSIVLDNVELFSADRYGNVFYIDKNQDVKKYGNDNLIYSSPTRRKIDHIEAWNSIKIFLFSREFQQYTLLDRYLTEMKTINFNPDDIGFIAFATIALDGNIWTIDYTDFSLKKINIVSNKVTNTTNLNLIIDQAENEILFMREYGNFLYVSTVHNGILVFDNLGTYKKKLPYDNIDFFSFEESQLYYLQHGKIHYFDLLKLNLSTEEVGYKAKKVIKTKKNLFYSNN